MADSVKNNTIVSVMTEVTEGTYVAPASATSFIMAEADGLELNYSKDLLERNLLNGSIGKTKSLTGMSNVSASIAVEAKAHGSAGTEPEYAPLLKGALGNSRQNTTVVTTKASGNTATVLQIEDADISKFNVGDIILVKQSGAYHVSPITSKTTGAGTATITMLVAHPSGDCSDSVTIEKFTTYFPANSGHPSLSISKYTESAKLEQAMGCKVSAMELSGWSTGSLAQFNFSLEGLSYDQSLTAPSYTPSYNSATPPVVLSATVYQDGVALPVNEVTISLENSLAFKTSTASANGKISSRVSQRTVTGTINPYKQSDSIAQYTKFKNNTSFSLFGYAAVPTSTAGEFEDMVAFYMPSCMITELTEGDADGLLQEAITFEANRGTAGSTEELYITIS